MYNTPIFKPKTDKERYEIKIICKHYYTILNVQETYLDVECFKMEMR